MPFIVRSLVHLYPRRWRNRHGDEMRELLAAEPLSLRTITDVIAGAIDARLNPQLSFASHTNGEEHVMRHAFFSCEPVAASTQDQKRAAAWFVGGSLVLAVAALGIIYFFGSNSLTEALLYGAFPAAFMLSSESTYLRRYSRAARLTMAIGGALSILLVMWVSVVVAYAI